MHALLGRVAALGALATMMALPTMAQQASTTSGGAPSSTGPTFPNQIIADPPLADAMLPFPRAPENLAEAAPEPIDKPPSLPASGATRRLSGGSHAEQ